MQPAEVPGLRGLLGHIVLVIRLALQDLYAAGWLLPAVCVSAGVLHILAGRR